MEQQALNDSSGSAANSGGSETPREGRNVWILTAYGISGLALFMILAYYLSSYLTR